MVEVGRDAKFGDVMGRFCATGAVVLGESGGGICARVSAEAVEVSAGDGLLQDSSEFHISIDWELDSTR